MDFIEINLFFLDETDCSTDVDPGDMMPGETIEYRCLANYQGLWAPDILWTDNMGHSYNPVNSTTNMKVEYSVSLTVDCNDTGVALQANLTFGPPPEGAIPPSDDKVFWAANAPSYTTSHQFDELMLYCKYPP